MTTSIRTIIVDDEPLALKFLAAKLAKHSNIDVIRQCRNGREAIEAVTELNPDLLFLDIQMPGVNGLEVIERLQGDTMPLVVFATAYEQYALNAFDANAIDYVLKPIDDERIARAVIRAQERLQLNGDSYENKQSLIQAIQTLRQGKDADVDAKHPEAPAQVSKAGETTSVSKIIVKDRDEIHIVEQADIDWIDAAGDYVCIHTNGQTLIKRSTLKEILDELDATLFKRVHRSTIVNMNSIKKVLPHTKGEFFLQLGEFDKVKVSRNYKEVIKDFLAS